MERKTKECDVLIIGSGVTGMAAAMYAARFDLKTIVVGDMHGGTITLTDEVSNYPGFKHLTGLELYNNIKEHALEYDVDLIADNIEKITEDDKGYNAESKQHIINTKTIILATGTKARKLQVPGEEEYFAKGVHTCALCDGRFYKEKTVAVIGGSDSAAKEALLLSEYANKVYIIYRGEHIHPEPINKKRIEKNNKIEIIPNTNIKEIQGETKVTKVQLDKEHKGTKELTLDAVFIEIGHTPLSYIAKELGVTLNEKKEIIINRNAETNKKGIYAAGDVADTSFKQAITGVAEGVTAAWSAYQYISSNTE